MTSEESEEYLGAEAGGPAVAVSLSGGGHRAALFGLGALCALSDLDLARNVASISSVSGGSITSASVGSRLNYRAASSPQFRQLASDLSRSIARDWGILRTPAVRVYLAAAVSVLVAVSLVVVLRDIATWIDTLLITATVALVWWARWIPAGFHFRRLFGDRKITHMAPRGSPPESAELRRNLGFKAATNHVLCATSLESGEHVYISDRFVFAPLHGWAEPDDIRWRDAVRASAALPGALPPKWMRFPKRDFSEIRGLGPAHLPLYDGGVYDNLADQWPAGLAHRLQEYEREQPALEIPEILFAVNSSSALRAVGRQRFRIPIVGEFMALKRAKDVMYNNAASLRVQGLIGKFDRAARQMRADDAHPTRVKAIQLATKLRGHVKNDREFVELIAEDSPSHVKDRLRRRVREWRSYDEQQIDTLLDLIRAEMRIVPGELAKKGLPMQGVVIEIDDSPFDIIHKYTKTLHAWYWPDREHRAQAASDILCRHLDSPADSDAPRTAWARTVDENRKVPTTLGGLGKEEAGRLMYHAYVLTLVNTWVILGDTFEKPAWIAESGWLPHQKDFEDLADPGERRRVRRRT